MSDDKALIAEAKALIANHEQLFEAGDLDAVMANFAEDAVMLGLETPVLSGKQVLRNFYQGIMEIGTWSFRHDYSGVDVVDNTVLLYGVAYGTHMPSNGSVPTKFANNFFIMTKHEGGRTLAWRAAFMPGVPE
jgi:uncharacterized protein (TIGR02246 family)